MRVNRNEWANQWFTAAQMCNYTWNREKKLAE